MTRLIVLVVAVALLLAPCAMSTTTTTTYRSLTTYATANCTGTVINTSFWPTGSCFGTSAGNWAIFACNATGSTVTSCYDALCSVNCTTAPWTPLGCDGTSLYGCVTTLPAPAADSVVTSLYEDANCTAPSEVLYTPVGCQTSGSITRTIGCNSSFTWSADCSTTTCAAGTCTIDLAVNPNAPCTPYYGYAWAKRECLPPGSSAAPSTAPSALLLVLATVLATIVTTAAGTQGAT